MPDRFGYLTVADMTARLPRLVELERGLRTEWERQTGRKDLLTQEERQEYVTAIWGAAKGLEAARQVMEFAVARMEKEARRL